MNSPVRFEISLPLENTSVTPADVCLELIGDPNGLQVNLLSDQQMETRIAVEQENGAIVLKIWKTDRWAEKDPDQVIVLLDPARENNADG